MHGTDELDIRKMGGLRKAMPVTAILFSIGALSLGGIPILAGFWSKDEILLAVNGNLHPVFLGLTLLTVLLSALYMARAMFVVFYGNIAAAMRHAHESPLTMTITMSLLGILALFFGFIAFNWPGSYGGFGTFLFYDHREGFHFTWWLAILSTVLAVAAFAYAYLAYVRRSVGQEGMKGRFAWLLRVVANKYYIDETYQWAIDRVALALSGLVAWLDRAVVNDVGVNGPADLVRWTGLKLRLHVTGHVSSYALAMALGLIALALVWWLRSV